MDIFDKIDNMGPIGQWQSQSHGYFSFPKLEGEIEPHMIFRGKRVLNWSLNNYLGLANLPEVRKADAEAAAQYGLAYPMGARMMSGQPVSTEGLEEELARFVGKPSSTYPTMVIRGWFYYRYAAWQERCGYLRFRIPCLHY